MFKLSEKLAAMLARCTFISASAVWGLTGCSSLERSQAVSNPQLDGHPGYAVAGNLVSEVLPANHPAIEYFGRIDQKGGPTPTLIWQGSRLSIAYVGQVKSVSFTGLSGSVYFDVLLDGETLGQIQAKNGAVNLQSFQKVSAHQRTMTLVKRSEASAGYVRIKHLAIAWQPKNTKPMRAASNLKLLFFGDSITAGACSEDGPEDQWEDRSTHNARASYAAQTAAQLHAEYQNISISGVGISAGYQDYTALDIWNRRYPNPDSTTADLTQYLPDIVFLNYGENDESYTKNQGQPFPSTYVERYLRLLDDVRTHYPHAAIVILRGGMWGGANSPRLRGPLEQVVATFTAKDSNAFHYAFKHWASTHPRSPDHRLMADELVAWMGSVGLLKQ